MADIRPFTCIHPAEGKFEEVAALPYDVYSRAEAFEAVKGKPYSFLNIDRPETHFPPEQDMYAPEVYGKAKEMFSDWQEKGILVKEEKPCFYIYALTMNGRTQNGIVAMSSVDDYLNNVIRKHELTLEEKEQDRIRHVDTLSAQTGPIFLAYRGKKELADLVARAKEQAPLFDFVSEDGIRHQGWKISEDGLIAEFTAALGSLENTYIADGHHRCASAVKVALKRRKENPGYTGEEDFNYILSVLFSDEELKILPYNRVLKSVNELSRDEFLQKVSGKFEITKTNQPVSPSVKGEIGMLFGHEWYRLTCRQEFIKDDPVEGLDVAYLQRELLTPVLGINDPRTDKRIAFVGGIRGTGELVRRCDTDCVAAFSMHPTSIKELLAVADAGKLMPPKSTWFEPKLRSGLFIHEI